jgi:6-phosphogluconolactonase (cycloisomerase 2 family)
MRVLLSSYGGQIAVFSLEDQNLRPIGPPLPTPAPSFLAVHPRLPVVYSVSELDDGAVDAFRLDDGFAPAGHLSTGGSQPCHLAVTPDGRHLACANYGSGSVAVFSIEPDGALARRTDLVQHSGSGPRADRQEGPHAHHVTVRDDAVSAVDLGCDAVIHYGLSEDGRLTQREVTHAEPGSGPRHLVTHPSGRSFVANELSSTVATYDASFRPLGSQPATLVTAEVDNYPSELVLSPDGRFLYVANRGNDSITTFAVGDEGLTPVDEIATGGAWPRHIAVVEDTLLVANQHSGTVTTLQLDRESGVPRNAKAVVELDAPACILPLRRG